MMKKNRRSLLIVLVVWMVTCCVCYYVGRSGPVGNHDEGEARELAEMSIISGKNLVGIYNSIENGEHQLALDRIESLISMKCNLFFDLQPPTADVPEHAVEVVGFALQRGFFQKKRNLGYQRRNEFREWYDRNKGDKRRSFSGE